MYMYNTECVLQVTGALNFLVRNTSDVETNVVSVERVKEYAEAETEVNKLLLTDITRKRQLI